MSLRRSLPAVVCCVFSIVAHAQTRDSIYVHDGDTVRYTYTPLPQTEAPESAENTSKANEPKARKDNFWSRIFHGNIDRTFEKKIDFSIIGAPSYAKESSFGLGMLASGLYRVDRTDSITPPSDVSFFGSVSLSGYYMVGVSGNTLFNHNRSRVIYETSFASKPLDYWGIGYEAGRYNEAQRYIRQQVKFDAGYLYEFLKHTYVGASLHLAYTKARDFDHIAALLEGQRSHYLASGFGMTLQYDSRDFIPNPQRGCYLMIKEIIYPKWMGNCQNTLFKTTITADYYQRLWSGGILAADLFGEFNSQSMPWCMLAELGGGYRMRGYYMGQYTDNNLLTFQLEYRQRIWRRFGGVLWGGAGNVFPSLGSFKWNQTLPNYGVGLRWEFKHRVNVRIDYGFGRKTSGVVFNINEAF